MGSSASRSMQSSEERSSDIIRGATPLDRSFLSRFVRFSWDVFWQAAGTSEDVLPKSCQERCASPHTVREESDVGTANMDANGGLRRRWRRSNYNHKQKDS